MSNYILQYSHAILAATLGCLIGMITRYFDVSKNIKASIIVIMTTAIMLYTGFSMAGVVFGICTILMLYRTKWSTLATIFISLGYELWYVIYYDNNPTPWKISLAIIRTLLAIFIQHEENESVIKYSVMSVIPMIMIVINAVISFDTGVTFGICDWRQSGILISLIQTAFYATASNRQLSKTAMLVSCLGPIVGITSNKYMVLIIAMYLSTISNLISNVLSIFHLDNQIVNAVTHFLNSDSLTSTLSYILIGVCSILFYYASLY